jgi:hypothetical protein
MHYENTQLTNVYKFKKLTTIFMSDLATRGLIWMIFLLTILKQANFDEQ